MLINLRCVLVRLGHTQYLPDILPVHTFCCFAGSSFSFSLNKTASFFSVFGIVVTLIASHFKVLYIFRNMILMMKLKITTILQFSLIAVVITGAIAITAVYGQTTFSPLFTSTALPIPMSVMFNLNNATIHCPNGTLAHTINTSYYRSGNAAALYSDASLGHNVGMIYPSGGKITFHLLWAHVSDDGNHYKLKGLWHDEHLRVCPGSDNVFPVDITGTCEGSIFAMTTPRINGYSITANSTQVSAACLHP